MHSFLVNKICQCGEGHFHPWSLNWPKAPDWSVPPVCRCGSGLWDDAPLRTCAGCQQEFYDWFSHPRRGFYQHKKTFNPVGWFCYSCLENALPTNVFQNPQNHIWFKTRIPPIPELVPPDYRHAVKVELPTEVQSSLDDFLAKLRGIVECPTVPNEPS
jgi:hypothetical protein